MIAMCAALRWEVRPVLRALRHVKKLDDGAIAGWLGTAPGSGRQVLVYRTGIGPERASASTRAALEQFPVCALINTGCCGALAPGLGVGFVVVAERVLRATDAEESCCPTDASWNRLFLEAARDAYLSAAQGPIVTTPVPFATAAEKRAAHERLGAIAVDMEAASVAAAARAYGLPFACARAVLDDATCDLPAIARIGVVKDGWQRIRLAAGILKKPSEVMSLVTLAHASRASERSLERLFAALLSHMHPPMGAN